MNKQLGKMIAALGLFLLLGAIVFPNYVTAAQTENASFAKGKVFYDKKQYADAIPEFTATITEDQKNAEAYRLRAASYRNLKQYEQAIDDYTKAIEIRPKSFACYYGRAMAKKGLKDLNGAIVDAEMAVQLATQKDMPTALLLLGSYKYDKADYSGSLETCFQAEKISATPENRNCVARAYIELGQLDQAVKVLDGIIKENDGLSYVYVNRAKAYIKLGYAMKARKDYDKAFDLKPDIRKSKDAKNDLAKIEVLQKSGTAKKTAVAVPSKATVKKLETFVSPTIGAKFVLIPAGTFKMGSPSDEEGRSNVGDTERQHQVTISQPFYLQTTEVTQGQWKKVMGNNPSSFNNCGDNCPVESLPWNDVQGFIRKLNQLEKTDKYYLPTEAQWEYAARAGSQTPFNTGACLLDAEANYAGSESLHGCPNGKNSDKTVRVGSFAPNAWGLYDMHGNVGEWVQDWYGEYPSGSVTDPIGPASGSQRMLRGGSWGNGAISCRSASRGIVHPDSTSLYEGFRLLKTR